MPKQQASLDKQWIPASEILRILGTNCRAFSQSSDPLEPAMRRRYTEIRSGKQKWISVAMADKLLTAAGHHLWELEVEPRSGNCATFDA